MADHKAALLTYKTKTQTLKYSVNDLSAHFYSSQSRTEKFHMERFIWEASIYYSNS